MAFSTANIYAPAITAIQEMVSNNERVYLTLDNICFIFALDKDYTSGSTLRSDLTSVASWFEAQSWITDTSKSFQVKMAYQSIKIAPEPSTT